MGLNPRYKIMEPKDICAKLLPRIDNSSDRCVAAKNLQELLFRSGKDPVWETFETTDEYFWLVPELSLIQEAQLKEDWDRMYKQYQRIKDESAKIYQSMLDFNYLDPRSKFKPYA